MGSSVETVLALKAMAGDKHKRRILVKVSSGSTLTVLSVSCARFQVYNTYLEIKH